MHGWLIINKPVGPGSTDIVSAVKRALRAGGYPKIKTGHGGTLDPLADGVLPVALGEATKVAGRMLDASKIYRFTISFGEQTDTLDAEGQVIATADHRPTRAQIAAILPCFTGALSQMPPVFSALKVEGKRAYDLARAGEEVVLKPREITIYSLNLEADGTTQDNQDKDTPCTMVTLEAHVSKGTYIRSLARDIALALGTVGHVTMLQRTKAGPFRLGNAISLDKLTESANARQLEYFLLPLTAGLDDIPALSVSPDQAKALRQGRKLIGIAASPGQHIALEGDVPVALVDVMDGQVQVIRGFNL